MGNRRRIVLATMGSLGDLHPFIAVAQRLKEHGHEPLLATAPDFRDNAVAAGIEFHAIGPTRQKVLNDLGMDIREFGRRVIGDTMFVLEAGIFPYLRSTYEDLLPALKSVSLLLTSTLMYSARFAAEKSNLPHFTVALQPLVFLSAYDPPLLDSAPHLAPILARLGPRVTRLVYGAGRRLAARRARPLCEFRRDLGLPMGMDALFEGQFSPLGTFAMYSALLGSIQPDFPPSTTITGFPFYDGGGQQGTALTAELEGFLAGGSPPLVFTLGSFAVEFPGEFFSVSREVARRLGKRAVLLVGSQASQMPQNTSSDVFVTDYAPYSELFPRSLAMIHHGGIGTTGQSLRSGRPQLVVPFLIDQFDNAARVVRLGVARSVHLRQYTPRRVTGELSALLGDPGYAAEAAVAAEKVRSENGAEAVARTIDRLLI